MPKTTSQMREYMREYRAKKRIYAKQKLGGCCSKCGSTENLEFDHIDRSTKVNGIASLLTNSKKDLEAELNKCQLLCKSCHKQKSIDAGDVVEAKHGLGQLYKRGCRCGICVSAKTEYRRSYYLSKGK